MSGTNAARSFSTMCKGRLMSDTQATHPHWDELAAFDRGHLPDNRWARVAEHVASCDLCVAVLDTVPEDDFVSLLRTAVAAYQRPRIAPVPPSP
jgi:hypothetical protein